MNIIKKIGRYLLSKFTKVQLLIIVALLICCFIISDSSIFDRVEYDNKIRDLHNQIEFYRNKTIEDSRKLNELRSDKDNIEKFARENYLMKKENEEIFIIE